jgi:hypothetical protein
LDITYKITALSNYRMTDRMTAPKAGSKMKCGFKPHLVYSVLPESGFWQRLTFSICTQIHSHPDQFEIDSLHHKKVGVEMSLVTSGNKFVACTGGW